MGKDRRPGYELLTALGLDPAGRLALGYAHLVAYGERRVSRWIPGHFSCQAGV